MTTAPLNRPAASRDLMLIKLGGSLITDKRQPETPRLDVLERLGREIAAAQPRPLIVGHGSGSFGHVAAARAGLVGGRFERSAQGAAAQGLAWTQDAAGRLHRLVVSAFLGAGLAPWTWPPSTGMAVRNAAARHPAAPDLAEFDSLDSGLAIESLGPLRRALALGLLPVTFGDVVLDASGEPPSGRIASTEEVLTALADRLVRDGWRVRRMLWLGETDGILDAAGETVPIIDDETLDDVRQAIAPAAGTDVTGGMLHRLETTRALAARGIESLLANGLRAGLLTSALDGESVLGTRVVPPASASVSMSR